MRCLVSRKFGLSLLLAILLVAGGMLPALGTLATSAGTVAVAMVDAAHNHGHDHADAPDGTGHRHDASWPDHTHEAVMTAGDPDLPRHVPAGRRPPPPGADPPSGLPPRLERPPRAPG